MKFKVGDKVIGNSNNKYYVTKRGWIGYVTGVCDPKYIVVKETIDDFDEFTVMADCFDLVNPDVDTKIVITTDGKTTTATKYYSDNGVPMKTVATARCAPEDEFDFNVGAELAMKRLMEAVNPVTVNGFKVGDRVTYFGHKGTIICINNYDQIGVQFDTKNTYAMHNCGGFNLKAGKIGELNMCKWAKPEDLKHIDPNEPEPPKYYNGKVVCVEVDVNEGLYTEGKIYEFIDGTFACDDGRKVHTWNDNVRFTSFAEWNRWSSAKWLEIKE